MIGAKTGTFPTAHKFISGIDIEKGENSIISSCERQKTTFPAVKGRKLLCFQL
jgi:hypothetical protein